MTEASGVFAQTFAVQPVDPELTSALTAAERAAVLWRAQGQARNVLRDMPLNRARSPEAPHQTAQPTG